MMVVIDVNIIVLIAFTCIGPLIGQCIATWYAVFR